MSVSSGVEQYFSLKLSEFDNQLQKIISIYMLFMISVFIYHTSTLYNHVKMYIYSFFFNFI